MPEEGVRWLPREDILSFEEIRDVVRSAIEIHGIRRFKLTGGEPTVRSGLVDLVGILCRIEGIEDLSLTTNGMRLADLARPLREAGLDRVTVSIDSLRPEKFRRITRTGDLATVLHGIDVAEEAGLGLKINCVTMHGTNDDELVDFARLSLVRRLTVRFIEYMPLEECGAAFVRLAARLRRAPFGSEPQVEASRVAASRVDDSELGPAGGCGAEDPAQSLIPETDVRDAIERKLGPLVEVHRETEPGVGPAKVYRLAHGEIPWAESGSSLAMLALLLLNLQSARLTANGVLRSCLFGRG